MRRAELISRLKETEPTLRAFGVAGLYLFGSYARDEAKSTSDIDIFVDPAPGKSFGLVPFMDTYEALKGAIGQNIDYGTRNGLHPLLRADVEREAVRIF